MTKIDRLLGTCLANGSTIKNLSFFWVMSGFLVDFRHHSRYQCLV